MGEQGGWTTISTRGTGFAPKKREVLVQPPEEVLEAEQEPVRDITQGVRAAVSEVVSVEDSTGVI